MATNNLDAYWMPFTANRQFKSAPRMLVSASGMHYRSDDGREILDGTAGLWCVNAGHARPRIVEAIARQAAELDYAPVFQMGHPKAFELAARLVQYLPGGLDHVFFTNSGSESVETALKIANAFHKVRGEGSRYRWVGRERAYHGVNYGGMSVGGIGPNRRDFGPLMTGVLHLRHTHNLAANAFSRGLPEHGADLADELERLVALNDASTISAVIVEPVAGSTGVLLPPKGYLAKLREICTKHGILLILDEVITGFGRLGAPFAVEEFDVVPDMVTCAKGITNGTVPMGAVIVRKEIYDAFMQGPEHLPELFHGYTYSGNPMAAATALATLDTYEEEGLLTRAKDLAPAFEAALHGLKGLPNVIDIRNYGLVGAVELAPRPGAPGRRAFDVFLKAYELGLLVRATGDTIALSPPLIISEAEIGRLADLLGQAITAAA
ncbi:MAG: aspartate aminotransferase family protein [Bauldia sp.]|nr:aspartate aminotransferase family protein [Bauldia sp.]